MNKVLLTSSENKISDKRVSRKSKNKCFSFEENIYFFVKISSKFYFISKITKKLFKFFVLSTNLFSKLSKQSKISSLGASNSYLKIFLSRFFVSNHNQVFKSFFFSKPDYDLTKTTNFLCSPSNKFLVLDFPKYIYE